MPYIPVDGRARNVLREVPRYLAVPCGPLHDGAAAAATYAREALYWRELSAKAIETGEYAAAEESFARALRAVEQAEDYLGAVRCLYVP